MEVRKCYSCVYCGQAQTNIGTTVPYCTQFRIQIEDVMECYCYWHRKQSTLPVCDHCKQPFVGTVFLGGAEEGDVRIYCERCYKLAPVEKHTEGEK